MKSIKDKLIQAGFEEEGSFMEMTENGLKFCVLLDPLYLEVYLEDEGTTITNTKITDLNDLSKKLYGYIHYYLDFSEKRKYDWEAVFSKLDDAQKEGCEIAINTIEGLPFANVLHYHEAESMVAQLKLDIIIRQIDKDYPPIPTETAMGGIKYQDGKLQVHYFQDDYSSRNSTNSKVVIATLEGAKILLDQNTQLLQNLFKIETDATE